MAGLAPPSIPASELAACIRQRTLPVAASRPTARLSRVTATTSPCAAAGAARNGAPKLWRHRISPEAALIASTSPNPVAA